MTKEAHLEEWIVGPDDCFYCGEVLGYPRIGWHGHSVGVTISMHPDCLMLLVVRLMRDRHEYEIKTNNPSNAKAAEYRPAKMTLSLPEEAP